MERSTRVLKLMIFAAGLVLMSASRVVAQDSGVAVTISPTSATVQIGGTQQFTANTAVSWSVAPAACGTIDPSSGLFTSAVNVNAEGQSCTVTATSVAAPSIYASATVTVAVVVVAISPTSATVPTGGTQPFTATVTGAVNTAVNWWATCGSISSSGSFAAGNAGGTCYVTATSAVDPSKSAQATVTVTGPPPPGTATSYGSTTINIPKATAADARGINDSGQIVGRYIDSSGNTHGFLYSGGSVTPIDCTGATLTEANGINNTGGTNNSPQVVGDYIDSSSVTHGFIWDSGNSAAGCTAIDYPNAASYTKAFGINDSGDVVGEYEDSGSAQHAFLLAGGTYTNIDYPDPNASNSLATGIDKAGHIVGQYELQDVWHGFLIYPSQLQTQLQSYTYLSTWWYTIDSCGSNGATLPSGINTAGEIVGECSLSSDSGTTTTDGFEVIGSVFTLLDLSGYAGADEVSGINSSGQIVGGAGPYSSGEVAFLMTPGNSLQTTEHQLPVPPGFASGYGESLPMLGRDSTGYYVVYSVYPVVNGAAGNASIYYQRVDATGNPGTNTPVGFATSSDNQWLEDASGDYIVYTLSKAIGQLGDIVLYRISKGTAGNLTTSGDCWAPRIYGDYVVWIEVLSDGSGQVVEYQISSGMPVQTTVMGGPSPSASEATVSDRYVAWAEYLTSQSGNLHLGLAAYDFPEGESFMVASNSAFNYQNPHAEGLWIAY